MTKDKIKQIVLDIIADINDEDLTDVKPEVRLRDQLDLDSMDFLDIVMELRKQHGIDVPEAEYRELERSTVLQIIFYQSSRHPRLLNYFTPLTGELYLFSLNVRG